MPRAKEQRIDLHSSRATSRINPKLEKQLLMYLASASAAGVGLAALSNTAQAKVVYTPANITVAYQASTPVDLNGDGVADVTLSVYPLGKSFGMFANALAGNAVRLAASEVAAGFFGVPVGPGEKFRGGSFQTMYVKVFGYGNQSSYGVFGPWINVTNRYLGVKFLIAGTTHFGWVRMTTSKTAAPLITGYAYETTPNTSIKDGTISGPEKVGNLAPAEMLAPNPQPASLGLLARGSDGIAIWRREEEAA
jgi:hypothetical protein